MVMIVPTFLLRIKCSPCLVQWLVYRNYSINPGRKEVALKLKWENETCLYKNEARCQCTKHSVRKLIERGPWKAVDTGVDQEVLMEEVPSRPGPCISWFIHGPAALAPLGSVLEKQTLRSTPDLLSHNLYMILGGSWHHKLRSLFPRIHPAPPSCQACGYLLPLTNPHS